MIVGRLAAQPQDRYRTSYLESMRVAYILIIVFFFGCQELHACSCYSIPSFEYTISNTEMDSSLLILGELDEFLEPDSNFPSYLLSSTDQYKYVAVDVIKDYFKNLNSEQVILLNGPSPACIQTFNYSIGSQLIIFAKQVESAKDGKKVFASFSCVESVLYYDRGNDMVKGNITPYNSFLRWIYNTVRIDRYPQDQITINHLEKIIERSLNK